MKPFENNGLANIVQRIRMFREHGFSDPDNLFDYIEYQALRQIKYNNRRANGEDIAWHEMEK